MRVAGDDDTVAWIDFIDLLPDEPSWVVSDQSEAIEGALNARWPNAVHYNCEGHLLKGAAKAAAADRVIRYRGQVAETIFETMEKMLRSEEHWAALKAAVSPLPPAKPHLRAWIANHEEIVLRQAVLRRENHSMPWGAGPVETYAGTMRKAFAGRTGPLRNASRLDRIARRAVELDAMRAGIGQPPLAHPST